MSLLPHKWFTKQFYKNAEIDISAEKKQEIIREIISLLAGEGVTVSISLEPGWEDAFKE